MAEFLQLELELGLKMLVYVRRWLAVVSDCTGIRVENETRRARQTVHTRASHMFISCAQHTCDYIGFARYVRYAARSSPINSYYNGLEYEVLILREVE